jgi:hypothetical protein
MVRGTHYRAPGSLCAGSFDNLVFSARKTAGKLLVEPPGFPFAPHPVR